MTIYAYIRVSTDRQSVENQRHELLKFADAKRVLIDSWVEETISSTKHLSTRQLSTLLTTMQPGDSLFVSELSRLGRSLLEIMSILHTLMEREVAVYAVKEGYELNNSIGSQVLAFAFGLSAQIERTLISARTKEALSRVKDEGKQLGRPKGRWSTTTKLSGHEADIDRFLAAGVSQAAIARLLGVNATTVSRYVQKKGNGGRTEQAGKEEKTA